MTSLTGLNCLQFGHLTLIRCKKRTVKSKHPQIIPKKRVSKMIVSMSFIFYYLRPLTKYRQEHLTSGVAVRRTRILVIFLLIRLKCFRKQKHGLKLLTVSVSNFTQAFFFKYQNYYSSSCFNCLNIDCGLLFHNHISLLFW